MVNGYFVCEFGMVNSGRVIRRHRQMHGYRLLWKALGLW